MTEAADRTPELLGRLLQVWEDSVRATHLFLSDAEIKDIKAYVPQALNGIAHLVTAAYIISFALGKVNLSM